MMSWSISVIGRPQKVAEKVAADLARIKCSEPEESIKNNIADSVAAALSAFPEGSVVRVDAAGSQYVPDNTKPEVAINTLNVKIEPLYGFVE